MLRLWLHPPQHADVETLTPSLSLDVGCPDSCSWFHERHTHILATIQKEIKVFNFNSEFASMPSIWLYSETLLWPSTQKCSWSHLQLKKLPKKSGCRMPRGKQRAGICPPLYWAACGRVTREPSIKGWSGMIQKIWKIYIFVVRAVYSKKTAGENLPPALLIQEEDWHSENIPIQRMPRDQPWKGSSGCIMPMPWKGQKIEKQPLGDRLGKSIARWPGKVQMRVKETPRSSGRSQPEARLTLQSTWVVSGRMTRNPALELSLIWSVCSRLVLISC